MKKVHRQNKLAIEYVDISKLKLVDYNPRIHERSAIDRLKDSISRYGMVDPIIVNAAKTRYLNVVGGHMRLKAAKELGYTQVPVVFVYISDIRKEKELNVRLNKNTGSWDYEKLRSWDVNLLKDVGFSSEELSLAWADSLSVDDDNFDVESERKKIRKPKTKLGDIYQLGDHVMVCGDATDPAVVKQLVGRNKIDVVYTDPPYNIGLSYESGIGGKGKYGGSYDDSRSSKEYKEFLKKLISAALAVTAKDMHFFLYCDQRHIGTVQSLYEELGIANKRVVLWIKDNAMPTPQVAFSKCYEPVVYGTTGKPFLNPKLNSFNEVINKHTGTGNQLHEDILSMIDLWVVKRLPGSSYSHPTEKSPTLHEKPLRRCSKPGDSVLDLCGGSFSTMAACEMLKRRSFTCEQDPVFCDLGLIRYKKLTGKEPKKIGTIKGVHHA